MLSSLYSGWMDALLQAPIPPETKATCENCAMLPQAGVSHAMTFHPVTKCCTYLPTIVNYRAGLILSDQDAVMAPGRQTVRQRLRERIDVTPLGLETSSRFRLLYTTAYEAFGRAPDLGCPHQIEGNCGIWRHSPATCTTWYCKHVRGETGHKFWADLAELLREIDAQLSLWCALQMGIDAATLSDLMKTKPVSATDLGAAVDERMYRQLWGEWTGREEEFYLACAELVRPLEWDDVLRVAGPRLAILSALVRQRYDKLTSDAVPDNLRMSLVRIEGFENGKYKTVAYSAFDPLRMSPELVSLLPHFDGRPTAEVLEELRSQRGIRVDPALVRRMADFGVLVQGER